MSLKIYNTLSGQKEVFTPITEGKVGMYVCGVTVYDLCHMGHARAGIAFDFIYRSLKYLGYEVTYVRNFTDVDDKIINRAAERKISCEELVEENITAFYEDMNSLYMLPPTHEPRATQYMPQMIALMQQLVEKGFAYESGGDLFFAVRKFKQYGELSGRNIDELEQGARVEVNDLKRDPLDFALWKAAKAGEPKWDSPWGKGRPGWHIECSAMGRDILGERFDIHGGGKDLAFPHHENEVAQSHGACGHPPVNYWMHNGFVNINKEKMSKSLGNFFTIRDVLKSFDAEAVRLYLLSTHYRSPIDFADEYLKEAERTLDRLYAAAARGAEALGDGIIGVVPNSFMAEFKKAIEDDFNSAAAMAQLIKYMGSVNSYCDRFSGKNRKNQQLREELDANYATFMEMASIMGLLNRQPATYISEVRENRLNDLGITVEEVESLIAKRLEARAEKDFAKSDLIRDELSAKGVELKDSTDGTTFSVKLS